MKLNWGTSIVIVFALFMCFILYFVYKVESDTNSKNELVVEEYYKHDAHFQDEMDKIQNANDLQEKPSITKNQDGILIEFPTSINPKDIHGKVSLYRPSNKNLDFEMPISNSSTSLLIPKRSLVVGLWDISIIWIYQGKEFIQKQTIYF
jgi:hypothetical protein